MENPGGCPAEANVMNTNSNIAAAEMSHDVEVGWARWMHIIGKSITGKHAYLQRLRQLSKGTLSRVDVGCERPGTHGAANGSSARPGSHQECLHLASMSTLEPKQ